MKKLTTVVIIIAITMICCEFATAQNDRGIKIKNRYATESGGVKWAVIIGINDYNDDGITDLRFAVNDAQKLYDLLIDENFGGFEKDRVVLISDHTKIKPTRNDILIALKSLEQNAGENDTIFIFFSGHGKKMAKVIFSRATLDAISSLKLPSRDPVLI